MTKIEEFNRVNLRAFQTECLDAIHAVAAKYGVTALQAGGQFAPDRATLKFIVQAHGQKASEARAASQELNLTIIGLDGMLGKRFRHKGNIFRVSGGSPNRPKFPVDCVRESDGKTFKFPLQLATLCLKGFPVEGAAAAMGNLG